MWIKQMIHMKCHDVFCKKNKKKNIKNMLQILLGA